MSNTRPLPVGIIWWKVLSIQIFQNFYKRDVVLYDDKRTEKTHAMYTVDFKIKYKVGKIILFI